MDQAEFIDTIRTSHRQLERYLFYFEKNAEGIFVASERSKFGDEEMTRAEIYGHWSLRDLLSHLIDWEKKALDWVQTCLAGETPGNLPPTDMEWERIDPEDFPVPEETLRQSAQGVLGDFKYSYDQVLSAVEGIPEEVLFDPEACSLGGEASLADAIALSTYRHYDWAKRLVRVWRKRHAGKYLNKEILVERIRTERRRLEGNLEALNEGAMQASGVVGEWSVKDILAHLVAWEGFFLRWYQAGLRGEIPELPAPGFGWEEIDALNRKIYEENRDRILEDVLEAFEASGRRILAKVESIPEEEMFTPGRYAWLGEGALAGYILANTANHYRWAKKQVRKWLENQNN